MSRMVKYQDLICPNCKNSSSSSHGINHAYLEWITHPVLGKRNGVIVMDGEDWEHGDVTEKATVENVPNNKIDCGHYHCNKCGWNWVEDTEQDWK
jgi:hypothetical protein